MMKVNNSDINLGLTLGISNQCVHKSWNSSPGAGVNAGSRVDMSFVASDPLTELVWSPQSGLSLKCAGSSFVDNKHSLVWDVGPSGIVFSPSHCIRSRETKDGKSHSEGNSIASKATGRVDSGAAKCTSSAKSPGSSAGPLFGSSHAHPVGGDKIDEVNYVEQAPVEHCNKMEDCCRDKENESLCNAKSIQIGNMDERGETCAGQEDQKTANLLPLLTNERPGMEITHPLSGKCKEEGMIVSAGKTEDIGSGSRRSDFSSDFASKIHSVKHLDTSLPNLPSLGRRHTELALVIRKRKDKKKRNGSTNSPFLEKLESTAENDVKYLTKDACEQSQDRSHRGDSVEGKASSSDSRIHLYQRKGKGKEESLSGREVDDRTSNDKDNSRGSMESCNSANLLLKGKRQWSFDQQLIFGSKRIKKQIQESPSSTSLVKPDSSFMNWISNMVKGSSKANQEEGHSLALTIGHPNHEHDTSDRKYPSCNKTRDFGGKKMGFQTIFQSLYCPDTKVQAAKIQTEDHSIGGSKELVLVDKTCGASTTSEYTSGYGEGPSIRACEKTMLGNIEAKDGVSSSDSFRDGKKRKRALGNSLDPLSEVKTSNNMGNTSDPLGSLWITRFTPKISCPLLISDHCELSNSRINFSIDQKILEAREESTGNTASDVGKELQKDDPNTEASIDLKKIGEHKCKKPVRLNSSESLESPEEMASVFVRRLDALKHIVPTAKRENPSQLRTACFFCGKSCHEVRNCSDVKENEEEGLLRNISLYNGLAEETPCLCIKCFQLDHWAATCPWPGKEQLATDNKRYFSMLESNESQFKVADSCDPKKRRVEVDITFNPKGNGDISSEQRIINLDEGEKLIASSSGKDKLTEEQLNLLCNLASKQITDAPKGMFDRIRRLRLSRTDVLKWMNSHISVSHLDGFFLRLRLAKWEEGLGKAGYYVAFITGAQREKSSKSSKSPIHVSVGGTKCLVETQYVSNNEFLEDELIAWWHKTSTSGRIPTEDSLKVKLEERKKLGL